MVTKSLLPGNRTTLIGLSLALLWGCSGGDATNGGSGGTSAGGAASTGGVRSSGGAATGGTTAAPNATGGAPATGGIAATGGALGTGGALLTGGRPATGGANPTGGTRAMGGSVNTGGSQTMGGSVDTGGNSSTGGSQPMGTTGPTGGRTNAGGSGTATGGSRPAGGASSIAGSVATGGTSAATGSCPTPALKSGDTTKKITVGSLNREYILHVPTAYTGSAAVPLVLDFHPIGGADTSWRTSSPYPAVIDKEGVISAFPNGEPSPNMGNAWNVEGCCVSKIGGADVDDIAFAKAIVAEIEKTACIDPKRVYAVGFSMGGGMSNYIACHAADIFAAVGPASFDLTQQNVTGCTPSRPITVLEWRGKNDTVVPYAGGHSALVTGMAIDFLGAVGTFQKWASLDGCTGSPSAADSNNCQTYSQCTAGVQVTLCTNNSGGHEAANANIIWPLLKKYTLP